MVTVPAVTTRSACLGLDLGTRPYRSKSNREPIREANSIKQQLVPYRSGHKLANLDQLEKSLILAKNIEFDTPHSGSIGSTELRGISTLRGSISSLSPSPKCLEVDTIPMLLFAMREPNRLLV